MVGSDDPTSYKEVIHSKESSQWMTSIIEELESCHKRKKDNMLQMKVSKKGSNFRERQRKI